MAAGGLLSGERCCPRLDGAHPTSSRGDLVCATLRCVVKKPFPAADLIEYVGSSSTVLVSELLGMSYGACNRWITENRHFTEAEAEKWAQYMGVHPSAIWHDLWWDTAILEPA